jgi:hypothetical protein
MSRLPEYGIPSLAKILRLFKTWKFRLEKN